jgi:lipopolysaccharide exporter
VQYERSDKHVGDRVAKGAAFLLAGRIVVRLFSLANIIVLARLLTPDDYGVAALAVTVITFLQIFSDVRVNQAIIALRHVDAPMLNTGFTINLARGVLIALVMLAFAEPIASFTREPRLADVMRVLAVVPLLDGLRNPAFMLFRRQIEFGREFWRTAIATLLGFAAALTMAILTRDYWAIVAGTIVGRLAESAFTYWRLPFHPRLGLKGARQFVSFGGWSTLDSVMLRIANQSPSLLLGRYGGAQDLGFFTVGYQFARLVTRELSMPLSSAFLPGLAAVAHDEERLRLAYRKAQAVVLGATLPMGLGVALLAPQFVALLAGDRWLPYAADVVRWTAPAMTIAMVAAATDALATARLELRQMALRSLAFAAIMLPAHYWAASTYGLRGVTFTVAGGALLLALMRLWMATSLLGDHVLTPFVRGWRMFAAAGAMCAAVLLSDPPAPAGRGELQVFLDLAPRIALGALVYTVVLGALWRALGRPDGLESRLIEAWPKLRRKLRI